MDQQPRSSSVTLPGAIIIAGALIAIAIIWVRKPPATTQSVADNQQPATAQVNMRPVTSSDHILGNPNAPVKIVEYSDPSCPACKMFNPIMEKIMEDYGPGGKVAWVYRHFPLNKPDQNGRILHKNAGNEAQAFECAAALGGNDKFWEFEKLFYEVTPAVTAETPDGLDQKQLPEIAKSVGLDAVSFNECLTSDQFKDKVEADYTDGINAGVYATPYSILITPSGEKIPLVGVQSYQTLKSAVDALSAETR